MTNLRIEGFPLLILVSRSEADVLQRWREDSIIVACASAVVALALGLLGWRLAHQTHLRHRSKAAVRESERKHRLLAEGSTDLIIQLGPDFHRVYVSPACRTLLGYEPQKMVGHHPRDLAHPDDRSAAEAVLASIAADGHAPPFAFRARRKDGSRIWVEGNGRKLPGAEGSLVSMRDITVRKQAEAQLHEANNRLQKLAMLDGMTGIANRRCFDRMLDKEFRRTARSELPVALLLDVDRFKAYNDTHGHPAGDECLRAVAGVLGRHLRRAADLAARYGGEEFAVLLPEADAAGAVAVAECVRNAVRHLRVAHRGSPDRIVTVSVGVAVIWPRRDGRTMQDLVRMADAALYRAKADGRDRVHLGTAQPALVDCNSEPAGPEQLDQGSA